MTGDYSDLRNQKLEEDFDDLPKKESMKRGAKHTYRTYLDTTLVKRWLYSKVGQDFDLIYSEFLTRIQPKYLDEYRECIFWYVEKKENLEVKENGEVWGKWNGKPWKLPYSQNMTFFVHPETNILTRLSD